ncbi:MAG TPA: GNAT family N-acetyltransferase [Moraxellaceae bacterium]|nr:GNAT family N-acetyltransferase [Moraxellaceae bacterium]
MAEDRYCTQLEPGTLVSAFLRHPPRDFEAWVTDIGLPVFAARFDLLTTMEPALRARVVRWPFYGVWGRWLRPRTCFVGTTVSEYALLPAAGASAADMVAQLKADLVPRFPFLIVKDIPQASPLLTDAANRRARELAAACVDAGFIAVEGQALAWVPIDFDSTDDFLQRFSAGRRKDLRRKLKRQQEVQVDAIPAGSAHFQDPAVLAEFYSLYRNVFDQSEIHFDLLTPAFFADILQDASSGGIVFVYRCAEGLAGFNLCFVQDDTLVDKYVGFAYPLARDYNLYFLSWFHNLAYARAQGLKRYVAGWTDPEIKSCLGARFTFTQHLVYVRNPLLRAVLRRLSGLFEADRHWQDALTERSLTD